MLGRSVLDPLSPPAHAISNLFVFSMVISLIIIVGIIAVLIHNMIRFRYRPGQGEPPQVFGNNRLEITWTVIPFLIVVVLFGTTISTVQIASPGQTSPHGRPIGLKVIGHQWWWEFRYPSGVVTANEIHIPVGERLVLQASSPADDVIHSFWLPQCGPKIDANPGQANYIWIECDKAGVYDGACAEFCGAGHAWMLMRVVVEPIARFDAWQRQQLLPAPALRQLRPPPPFTARDVALGQRLFTYYTCQNCHAITTKGTNTPPEATNPDIGPNLTHMGSRQILAAGRTTNTISHMEQWLADPEALKPGVHMPDFQLPYSQVRALTAYLESLR